MSQPERCGCGDPYCPSCGDPSMRAVDEWYEDTSTNILRSFYSEANKLYERLKSELTSSFPGGSEVFDPSSIDELDRLSDILETWPKPKGTGE